MNKKNYLLLMIVAYAVLIVFMIFLLLTKTADNTRILFAIPLIIYLGYKIYLIVKQLKTIKEER